MTLDDESTLITGGTGGVGRKFVQIAPTRYNP
jgi:NADPH:quinone reductase-like Zn-dependent oxidoreductase